MRRLVAAVAALVVVCSACSEEVEGVPTGPKPWDGGPLATPLSFHIVKAQAPGPCPGGELQVEDEDPDGNPACLELEPAAFEITELSAAEPKLLGNRWTLDLDLTDADGARFAELTAQATSNAPPRNRIALVRDGELITAPTVQGAITGGKVSLSGDYTKEDIVALIKQLRGS